MTDTETAIAVLNERARKEREIAAACVRHGYNLRSTRHLEDARICDKAAHLLGYEPDGFDPQQIPLEAA